MISKPAKRCTNLHPFIMYVGRTTQLKQRMEQHTSTHRQAKNEWIVQMR
jgi:hypothetical protein